jgi:hypothetical protein
MRWHVETIGMGFLYVDPSPIYGAMIVEETRYRRR